MVPYQMATLSIDRSVTKGHDVTMNEALTHLQCFGAIQLLVQTTRFFNACFVLF